MSSAGLPSCEMEGEGGHSSPNEGLGCGSAVEVVVPFWMQVNASRHDVWSA